MLYVSRCVHKVYFALFVVSSCLILLRPPPLVDWLTNNLFTSKRPKLIHRLVRQKPSRLGRSCTCACVKPKVRERATRAGWPWRTTEMAKNGTDKPYTSSNNCKKKRPSKILINHCRGSDVLFVTGDLSALNDDESEVMKIVGLLWINLDNKKYGKMKKNH